MKKFFFAFAGLSLMASAASAGPVVIITQVIDGPLTGGQPKVIELTNIGNASADMTQYGLINSANGAGFGAPVALTGTLAAGASYIVTNSAGSATNLVNIGCQPADFINGLANINGDDAVGLFDISGAPVLVDIYGEELVDGTGALWEHLDSYATRGDFGPNTTWTAAEWTVAPINTLDPLTTEASLAPLFASGVSGTGVGNHPHTTVPVEISAIGLE